MLRPVSILFCLAALASTGAASAQDNSAATSVAAATPVPVKEKKICRTEETTGSMMPHRTCYTKAQWVTIDGQNKANVNSLRDSMHGHSGGGGG